MERGEGCREGGEERGEGGREGGEEREEGCRRKEKKGERGREGGKERYLFHINSNSAQLTRKFSQKWKVASEQSSSTG